MTTGWDYKRESTAGTVGKRHLDKLLAENWKPFAVTRDAQGVEYVHLRRRVG